jgi:hypothetical protein
MGPSLCNGGAILKRGRDTAKKHALLAPKQPGSSDEPVPGWLETGREPWTAHPKPDHAFNLRPVGVVKKPMRRRHLEGPGKEGT